MRPKAQATTGCVSLVLPHQGTKDNMYPSHHTHSKNLQEPSRTFKNLQRTMTDTPTYSSSPYAIKDKANGNPWWCQRELVKAYNACAKSPIDCVHFGHMKSSPFLLSSCLEKDSIDKMEANVIRHAILMRPDSSRIEPNVAYVSIEYPFKSNMYEPDLQLQNEQLAILKQHLSWTTWILGNKYITISRQWP